MGGELHTAQAVGGEIRVSDPHHYAKMWIRIQLFTLYNADPDLGLKNNADPDPSLGKNDTVQDEGRQTKVK
jgi:hypothetical protein